MTQPHGSLSRNQPAGKSTYFHGPLIATFNNILETHLRGEGQALANIPNVREFLSTNFFIKEHELAYDKRGSSGNLQQRVMPSIDPAAAQRPPTANVAQVQRLPQSGTSLGSHLDSRPEGSKSASLKPDSSAVTLSQEEKDLARSFFLGRMEPVSSSPSTTPPLSSISQKKPPASSLPTLPPTPPMSAPVEPASRPEHTRVAPAPPPTKPTLARLEPNPPRRVDREHKDDNWMTKRLHRDIEALRTIKKRPVKDQFGNLGALPVVNMADVKTSLLQNLVKQILRKQCPNFLESEGLEGAPSLQEGQPEDREVFVGDTDEESEESESEKLSTNITTLPQTSPA